MCVSVSAQVSSPVQPDMVADASKPVIATLQGSRSYTVTNEPVTAVHREKTRSRVQRYVQNRLYHIYLILYIPFIKNKNDLFSVLDKTVLYDIPNLMLKHWLETMQFFMALPEVLNMLPAKLYTWLMPINRRLEKKMCH
jgi:hypothetical protein